MLVTVLIQGWHGGEDHATVFYSPEKAEKFLADYCREAWIEYFEENTEPKELSSVDSEAIATFYDDFYDGEWYDINTMEVQ